MIKKYKLLSYGYNGNTAFNNYHISRGGTVYCREVDLMEQFKKIRLYKPAFHVFSEIYKISKNV